MAFDGVDSENYVVSALMAVLKKHKRFYKLGQEIATDVSFNDLKFDKIRFHALMAELQRRLDYEMLPKAEVDLFNAGKGTFGDIINSFNYRLHCGNSQIPVTIKLSDPDAGVADTNAQLERPSFLSRIGRVLWNPLASPE